MSDEEQELYDEFGNYIGPDLDDDDSSSDEESSAASSEDGEKPSAPDDASDVSDEDGGGTQAMVIHEEQELQETGDPASAIVLHEDKEHYPSADQVYGEEVRTAVLDEDAMDLDVPLVEPVSTKSNLAVSTGAIATILEETLHKEENLVFRDDYLSAILSNETTRTRRGVALVGHLHCGKTTLLDLWLEQTSRKPDAWGPKAALEQEAYPRYTDTLESEQKRRMSLVSTPLTTILPDSRGKSYAMTILDCPGHANFHDESVAALRGVDGAVVVLDAVEGIMLHTEMVVRQAVSDGLPICLMINKVDRLILELKMPPRDTYYKLLNLIDSMNDLIGKASNGRYPKLSPERGNVAFASALHGWCFTLGSYAQLYLDHCCLEDDEGLGDNLSTEDFAKRLWGDSFYDMSTKTFHTKSRDCQQSGTERTFCTFILEPLYKIYTACLAESETDVSKLLRSVGVLLNRDQLRSSARQLLRAALSRFFGSASGGFVDMVAKHIPCPAAAARGKVARCYSGPMDSSIASAMMKCDPRGPLMIHCIKLYASPDGQSFSTLGRIYSGTVRPGDQVRVLGEGYSPDDDEDMAVATVSAVSIPRGRSRTEVTMAKAGNWVLLEGVDSNISKTATITAAPEGQKDPAVDEQDEPHIFTPLKFSQAGGESVVKLAVEPLNPAELPKMVEGLRRISKAYPMARTRVEESGEHVLFGTGELYLDCIMHDLRHVYSDIEVKVADPVVGFRETVSETSSVKCFAETANKRNKLTLIAEPLDDGLAEKLESGKVNIDWDNKKLGRFFQTKYDWDLLSSRSVWAFGSSPTHGTNLLMDDTLPSEVDKVLLNTCKQSIVQGFQWATREGPLCEEPVRGTKIKILDAILADKPIHRGGGQMIPTARRTVHSSLLTATPRLMEPIYRLQIQCVGEIVESIQPVLTKRRGHIVQDKPITGSTLYSLRGFIPVLDSFGFETDLRTFTQGQAMVHSVFDHWEVVPGDPLDRNVILHPLEPSPPGVLARELLVKTRRRKGLSEDVSTSKFFDEGMKEHLAGEADIEEVEQ
mmetsp:Transcript_28010/g.39380  ORF Transcript_28010/g.39380 Transcript_28010/m.39380 type:complete len:1043 (-) Transcript_28010:186-3314(-)